MASFGVSTMAREVEAGVQDHGHAGKAGKDFVIA
jgi:hypothetical protein